MIGTPRLSVLPEWLGMTGRAVDDKPAFGIEGFYGFTKEFFAL
jgi:hypothetical protein